MTREQQLRGQLNQEQERNRQLFKTTRAEEVKLTRRIRELEHAVGPLQREHDARVAVAAAIMNAKAPDWTLHVPRGKGFPGVPISMLTDWHTGEHVNPVVIYGLNQYNRATQEARIRRYVHGLLDLLFHHQVHPVYPGIILPINGDMVSGGIHEELVATNWASPVDSAKLCTEWLIWIFESLLTKFKYIYAPCVTGNHGRLTKFMEYKRRRGTSMDALIYEGLARHFKTSQKRVRIDIAEGASVRFSVYDHWYTSLHGDQFSTGVKGGDGFIGSIGPIIRGTKKILGRNAHIGMPGDTMLMGHWHRTLFDPQVIVGNSMKGFDEMCMGAGYDFERPSQALWLHHPDRGPAIYSRVMVDPKKAQQSPKPWVSFEAPGDDPVFRHVTEKDAQS